MSFGVLSFLSKEKQGNKSAVGGADKSQLIVTSAVRG